MSDARRLSSLPPSPSRLARNQDRVVDSDPAWKKIRLIRRIVDGIKGDGSVEAYEADFASLAAMKRPLGRRGPK